MATNLQLGPFEVQDRIGKGGMGVVHRGRHHQTGEPVAIKVSKVDPTRSGDGRESFRREARALARLHHPAIAAVVDYGELGASEAAAGPTGWAEGAPWFAMEYVDGSPLGQEASNWGWPRVESFLLSVLDALSHAHARTIIHRDLKPSNVLVGLSGEGETGVKLVDFGISRVFRSGMTGMSRGPNRVVGTPKYMAPEQIRGSWRDQGPHTDLYALGCLTWWIVCGSVPFDGETTEEVLEKQLNESPPRFQSRVAVPDGFEAWLRGLLEKRRERRTSRAADAAWSLMQLSHERRMTPMGGFAAVGSEAPEVVRSTLGGLADTIPESGGPPAEGASAGGAERSITRPQAAVSSEDASRDSSPESPPIPPEWEREIEERSAAVLPEAGLELFGLREIPVVDRERERDRLWEALQTTEREQRPHLVTLEGGAGTGKSRLAEWLGRRAAEVGAAEVLRGSHTAESEPDQGMRDMFRRRFDTAELPRDEVFERLLSELPSTGVDDSMRVNDARGLTELLRPTSEERETVAGPAYRFEEPGQKYALVRRLLERMASERRLIIRLDDLHWGREAVGMLEDLFTQESGPSERLPVLFVATIRSDLLVEEPSLQRRLDELLEASGAERIDLEPLGPEGQQALIDRLLDLDPELAEALAERSEGHPLFAVQLLQSWVDRDLLVPGPRGFQLREGAEPQIPADVHELWLERIQHLVDDLPGAEPSAVCRALEWAAVLGREITGREWRAVCREVGLENAELVRVVLLERGLGEATEAGWAFEHALLVESLVRRAEEHGRLRAHHYRSAELLEQLGPGGAPGNAARRADHWEAAGEWGAALEALIEWHRRLHREGAYEEAVEVLERREQLLDRSGAPPADPRRLDNAVERAISEFRLGSRDPEEALEVLEPAAQEAQDEGYLGLAARAWTRAGLCLRRASELERACRVLRRSVEVAEKAEAPFEVVRALNTLAWTERGNGTFDEAREHYDAARRRAREIDARYQEAKATHGRAAVELTAGNHERARDWYERALETSREEGFRMYEGSSLNGLGELARMNGDLERAHECYLGFVDAVRELNHQLGVAVGLQNIAQIELKERLFDRARERLDRAAAIFERLGQGESHRHVQQLCRLVWAAGVRDWSAFDAAIEPYLDGWPEGERLVADYPWLLKLAGEYAAEMSREERARRAWELGRDVAETLEDPDMVEELEELLAGLG